jgi:hypothetical protein
VLPAQAATVPSGFKTWTTLSTSDIHKVWTVNFTMPIDSNTVNSSNIYATDDNNQPVNTTLSLSADRTSVQITGVNAYVPGKKYWIFITGGITAFGGEQQLSQPVAIPFTVTGQTSNTPITSVQDSYSSYITSFTVSTLPGVFSVNINQSKMLYQGNYTFAVGMTGLKQGQTVTIYAYDSNGHLLQSQKYTVN